MESFEDSNCRSSDSFSLYERYLRSFNVVNNFRDHLNPEPVSLSNCSYDTPNIEGNIDLSAAVQCVQQHSKHFESTQMDCVSLAVSENTTGKLSSSADTCNKVGSPCNSPAPSLYESCSLTVDHNINDKFDPAEVPVSSDESKSNNCFKQPIFITSTMENSNNAVDMLRDVRHSESVFKLPISELSFNGTIKHVLKLKPIVDPITALTANPELVNMNEKSQDQECFANENSEIAFDDKSCLTPSASDVSNERSTEREKGMENTGDSHYADFTRKESTFLRPNVFNERSTERERGMEITRDSHYEDFSRKESTFLRPDVSDERSTEGEKGTENTGDSHYEDFTRKERTFLRPDVCDERSTEGEKGTENTGDSHYEDFTRKESTFLRPDVCDERSTGEKGTENTGDSHYEDFTRKERTFLRPDVCDERSTEGEKGTENTGDSHYEDFTRKERTFLRPDVCDERSTEGEKGTENTGDSHYEDFTRKESTFLRPDVCDERSTEREKGTENTGDSHYEDFTRKGSTFLRPEEKSTRWSNDLSYSSLEASFDSGVRSPDMFCSDDEDAETNDSSEPFWNFLKEYEQHDKKKVKKMEEKLLGVLPPPSVTTLRTDVTEMLKKYYCFLPAFNNEVTHKEEPPKVDPVTPTKRVSFVEIPTGSLIPREETAYLSSNSKSDVERPVHHLDTSANDKSVVLEMCTEAEVKESSWPDILKCRHYDVYYNVTSYSEKMEMLSLRYGERYVGAETETSVNVYSGGLQSPSSAHKRKALRIKMAQAKSPGRRLSHLARRRQAFCSAATINEKAQTGSSKMVLIDKNYFPHRKLISSTERKSPRLRRTPGKKTPIRKTPGKKTPAKTPKTKSGGSSRKKIMRRLLMDSESMTRSQPTRETLKRALFVSPDNRKSIPTAPSTSVPLQAMKSKRALFSSPDRTADTKSADGTQSDHFLKRKLSALDEQPENSRSKIAKSLSFGGDTIGSTNPHIMHRRASEVFSRRNSADLNETHKKKLLWAVSEALRIHGWRMSSPGFREKAEALARLTRRLLTLPPHAAKFASPKLSTSETMLKLARQYVYAIIRGRSIEDCFQEEQMKLSNDTGGKLSGYITANAYQQFKARQNATSTLTSQIKENTCNGSVKQEQPRSGSKNVLQDKLTNVDSSSNSNSNSSMGFSTLDKSALFKSNSMPSFEEAAKMRARRQISFDNVDFPKR